MLTFPGFSFIQVEKQERTIISKISDLNDNQMDNLINYQDVMS